DLSALGGASHGQVSGVGLGPRDEVLAPAVPRPHRVGVAPPGVGAGEFRGVVACPQSGPGVAEGGVPALGTHAGAGQDHERPVSVERGAGLLEVTAGVVGSGVAVRHWTKAVPTVGTATQSAVPSFSRLVVTPPWSSIRTWPGPVSAPPLTVAGPSSSIPLQVRGALPRRALWMLSHSTVMGCAWCSAPPSVPSAVKTKPSWPCGTPGTGRSAGPGIAVAAPTAVSSAPMQFCMIVG